MKKFFFRYKWMFFLVLLFPWFFIGGPGYESSRILKEAWNLGHSIFFAVFALEMENCLTKFRLPSRSRPVWIILCATILAAAIELVQSSMVTRQTSLLDFALGVAGCVAVVLWQANSGSSRTKVIRRASSASLLGLCLIPFLLVSYDQHRIKMAFPVLCDFESSTDISRWSSNGQLLRVRSPVKSGNYALGCSFRTKSSWISFREFPENWMGYTRLRFSVYNAGEPISLHYRIHDLQHWDKLSNVSDRYYGQTVLNSGWNTVETDTKDIESGPEARKMDMAHIRNIRMMITGKTDNRMLVIDDMELL